MNNPVAWKAGMAMAMLFGLGVATGYLVARRTPAASRPTVAAQTTNGVTRAGSFVRNWSERRMAAYRELLQPTPEQEFTIARHFGELQAKYVNIRSNTCAEVNKVVIELNKAIAAELTPQQRKVFLNHLKQYDRKDD
jgi:hypothetical protein